MAMAVKSVKQLFAERFTLALAESGLEHSSQKELGKFFEVSGQAVRKWINAESIPNSSRAPLVAEKLQIRRAWLIDGELPMREISVALEEKSKPYSAQFSLSGQELVMVENYRKLPFPVRNSISSLLVTLLDKTSTD